jgi:hypothetical protein
MITVLTIVIALVCGMGCINSQGIITPSDTVSATLVVATPTVTVIPTIVRTTTIVPTTTEPTPIPEPTLEAIEPDWTQPPIIYPPAEKDTTKINFTEYINDAFRIEYPSTWAATFAAFTVTDTKIYGKDMYKQDATKVSFISEDSKTRMIVIVYDLLAPARYTYHPTIDDAKRSITALYPDANGETAISNYKYADNEQKIMVASFDAVVPGQTYTEQFFLTYNHGYRTQFIVQNSTLEEYNELRYRMTNSLRTEGMQTSKWW